MRRSKSLRVCIAAGLGAAFIVAGAALALPVPPIPENERQVYLVRQDQSDCQNTTVPNGEGPNVSGIVTVIRGQDGNTTVNVALTAKPDMTYHFFLKCVRLLGDIKTGDEGTALATFTFATNSTGNIYAFDSYPEGAPPGNKFQSAQVKF